MRILLVTPSDRGAGFEYVHSGRENLGVEYLLAALRGAGHEAVSRNENIPGGLNSESDGLNQYGLLGFSLPFWEYRDRYVEAVNGAAGRTRATLIIGGHAATIGARFFLGKCPQLLGVVMGEGEETLNEIAEKLDRGESCHNVEGFMTRGGYRPRQNLMSLDELRLPARDDLQLNLLADNSIKEALVESTRGCTYRCSFCSVPPYYKYAHGKRWRERSIESLCSELTDLITKFSEISLISFTDDNFLGFSSRFHQRAIQVARHLHSLNPKVGFEVTCRVDAVEREPFAELASLGLEGVYLGIESGVQRVLDSFQKGTTVKQNLRAIQILSELGLGCDVGFITFSPGMKLEEVKANLEFLKNISEEYPIFVHPGAVFRCLREYPKDLGVEALRGDSSRNLAKLGGPVQALYEALDRIWHDCYEETFIRLEGNAASHKDDFDSLDRQKRITAEMIQAAFDLLAILEARPNATSSMLVNSREVEAFSAVAGGG